MKLNNSPDKTLADFEALMQAKNQTPTSEDLKKFVDVSIGLDWDILAGNDEPGISPFCRNTLVPKAPN